MRKGLLILTSVFCLAFASTSYAAGDKVEVSGDVDMSVMTDTQVALATGNSSVAINENNKLSDNVKIKGNVTMTAEIPTQISAATGSKSTACNANNVIGTSSCVK